MRCPPIPIDCQKRTRHSLTQISGQIMGMCYSTDAIIHAVNAPILYFRGRVWRVSEVETETGKGELQEPDQGAARQLGRNQEVAK